MEALCAHLPTHPAQVMLGFLKARPTLKKEVPSKGGGKKTITHTHTHTHTRTYNVYIYINNPSLEFQPVHLMFIDRLHRDQYPPYSQLERR